MKKNIVFGTPTFWIISILSFTAIFLLVFFTLSNLGINNSDASTLPQLVPGFYFESSAKKTGNAGLISASAVSLKNGADAGTMVVVGVSQLGQGMPTVSDSYGTSYVLAASNQMNSNSSVYLFTGVLAVPFDAKSTISVTSNNATALALSAGGFINVNSLDQINLNKGTGTKIDSGKINTTANELVIAMAGVNGSNSESVSYSTPVLWLAGAGTIKGSSKSNVKVIRAGLLANSDTQDIVLTISPGQDWATILVSLH